MQRGKQIEAGTGIKMVRRRCDTLQSFSAMRDAANTVATLCNATRQDAMQRDAAGNTARGNATQRSAT